MTYPLVKNTVILRLFIFALVYIIIPVIQRCIVETVDRIRDGALSPCNHSVCGILGLVRTLEDVGIDQQIRVKDQICRDGQTAGAVAVGAATASAA